MKVLVACEESQRVCTEFRKLGHEAYSCDIEPCSGGHPEWHIQDDVLPLLNGNCDFKTVNGDMHHLIGKWDMIIAFPPCTHLAVSGAAWFDKKREDGRQEDAIKFFMNVMNADCDKISVENPVNIISGNYIEKHFPELQKIPISYKAYTINTTFSIWRQSEKKDLFVVERTSTIKTNKDSRLWRNCWKRIFSRCKC